MKNRIFTEKYRPNKIDEVVGIPQGLRLLLNNMSDREAILLTSTPGVGKTCISKILEKQFKSSLVINASDERGIDVIRSKVLNFAINMSLDGGPKFIGLEEMDALTPEAQKSLRKVIEDTPNCIWLLTANYENKIINAIKNRCTHFKLVSPDEKEIKVLLNMIVTEEKIIITEEAISKIIELNYPSIRGMVKKLQLVSRFNKEITADDITKDSSEFMELIDLLKNKKHKEALVWMKDSLLEEITIIIGIYQIVKTIEIKDKALFYKYSRKADVDLTQAANKEGVMADYFVELMSVL